MIRFALLPLFIIFVGSAFVFPAWAPAAFTPVLELSLKQAEQAATASSGQLQAVESERDAQAERTTAQYSLLWPKLSFEASYRYQTDVASIPQPSGARIPLGDHGSYSIGPVLNWTVVDFGSSREAWNSSKSVLAAKGMDSAAAKKQLLYQLRAVYFRTVLSSAQMKLVQDSLKLAEAQYKDIRNRRSAGSSSQIDALSSHKEVLSLQREFRQARSDLSQSTRDLLSLVNLEDPTESIRLESLSDLSAQFQTSSANRVVTADTAAHPRIQALAFQAEAQSQAASGIRAGLLPRIHLSAKASYDYPNGPVLERIQQNTVGVNLSLPLFELSRTRAEAAEKSALAQATEFRRIQAQVDLARDVVKAKDLLESLREQKDILTTTTQETAELAALVYESYKAGRSGYLEVQSANLRALDARVQAARNEVQILMQLALLENLTDEK
ncbi:MAG: hypothetical protein A2Z97_01840 [Bdellovibrionales bacterium GWB1_52_6]|nr:MAG: hypothetical protein A2Z97_01840 [Bdellovibrionales bacterium GWB1_52_6]OFZ04912.1 MAG: hypothetical protein A2X97_16235 [Bdellovibrionales bacterium GWA1_52_35]